MVPVNDQLCTYIDFAKENDQNYKALLEKEHQFLKPMKDSILKKATEIYNKQKTTGIIESCYCTYSILENAYNEYISKYIRS